MWLIRAHTPLFVALLAVPACGEMTSTTSTGASDSSMASGMETDVTTTDGQTGPGSTGGTPKTCDNQVQGAGEATYYGADGSGNCSFPATPQNLMVAAMNDADYLGSEACGACVTVSGPTGEVTVRIVDRCPGCAKGDIDLSESAFAAIANPVDGRVPVTWSYTDCNLQTPLNYHFKEGSNEFWSAIQVRDHNHPIATLEYSQDGGDSWTAMARENYNYFLEPAGLGAGPYTLRVTDIYGHQQVDSGLMFAPDSEVAGAGQLPVCGG